ncbi:hypothetical protein ACRAWD_22415 [Caulobacter segnis]
MDGFDLQPGGAAALALGLDRLRGCARAVGQRRLIHDMGQQLKALARARGLWAVALVAGVYYLAPGLVTTLFYLQQNTLHLTTPQQGYITFASGVGGVFAATAYGLFAARRFKLRVMLLLCLALGSGAILLFNIYGTFAEALIVETISGFTAALCEVVLIHVAVRATPRGSEALGFCGVHGRSQSLPVRQRLAGIRPR